MPLAQHGGDQTETVAGGESAGPAFAATMPQVSSLVLVPESCSSENELAFESVGCEGRGFSIRDAHGCLESK